MQIAPVESGPGVDAEQAEADVYLLLQQFEQAQQARLSARSQTDALHAADADQARAGSERLDDVGAAIESAVDDDGGASVDRGGDFGQHVHRAAAVIELAPAVIRDVD